MIVRKLHNTPPTPNTSNPATSPYDNEVIQVNENIKNVTMLEIISLLLRFIARRFNTQHLLFLLAFLTFGIGDAVTAAIMMESKGIVTESNPMVVYIYTNYGFAGLIFAKIWFTIILLMGSFIIYWNSRGKSYWMVNGFLISLATGGTMAIMANLQATLGLAYMNPTEILIIYMGLVLILVEAGDIIDNHMTVASSNHAYRGTKLTH